MKAIRSLLANGNQLKAKYGLKVERRLGLLRDTDTPPSAFERVFQGTAQFWNTSLQRKEHIKDAILWTIGDKDKFEDLVDHLRSLITDLGQLTEPYGVAQSQTWIVKYEMEKIEDESSLEVITQVNSSAPDDDLVSVAASRQLAFVRERSVVAGQPNKNNWGGLIQPNDSISLINQPKMPQIHELEEEVNLGSQPLEITRVLPSQWRNVKTRQGLFPWLGVLIVCTNMAVSRPLVPVANGDNPDTNDPLGYIRRAMSFKEDGSEIPEVAESVISPSRVAINSKTLLAILGKITGRRIPESNNVLVHPFKYILLHEDRIRKVYKSVCEECEAGSTGRSTDVAVRGDGPISATEENSGTAVELQSDEDLLGNIARVRDELRCLVELMDTDLATLFQHKKTISSGQATGVAFEHLWLYYKPNFLGYSNRGNGDSANADTTQGYMILHVTGGRPVLDVSHDDAVNTASSTRFSQLARPGDIRGDEYANTSTSLITPFILDCLFLDTDGLVVGPRPRRIVIPPYTGIRHYGSLPLSPSTPEDRKVLNARGSVFLDAIEAKLGGVGYFTFSGTSNAELEPGHSETCRHCSQTTVRDQVDGAVIVDPAAAIQYHRSQSCTLDVQFGVGAVAKPTQQDPRECFEPLNQHDSTGRRYTDVFDDSVIDLQLRASTVGYTHLRWAVADLRRTRDNITELDIRLLPARVLAFSLANRKWYSLPTNRLAPVIPDNRPSVWDDIILPPGHKDLVLALVSALGRPTNRGPRASDAHKTQYEGFSSISNSQRRSLIVLMHGAPGTGKTHLVEGVADHLRRPLVMINCAELGTVERGATTKLDYWFGLAKKWGCVLLLKEVDAFLARRTQSDEVDRVEITSGTSNLSHPNYHCHGLH